MCSSDDTKLSDGEVPVMLEFWRMGSTPSLPSHPDPIWTGMVAPDWVLFIGQIELNCVHILNWIIWHLTVCKQKLYWTELFKINLVLNDLKSVDMP